MDFHDAQTKYARLKQQYEQGQIGAEEFERQVNDMTVTDSGGTSWQIGVSTGKWFRREGERWVEALPPEAGAQLSSPPPIPPPPADNYTVQPASRSRWPWILGGLAALALVGCIVVVVLVFVLGGSNPEPSVGAAPSAMAPQSGSAPSGNVAPPSSGQTALPGFDPNGVFVDDFSDPNSGWDRQSSSDGITDYGNGKYRIQVNASNTMIWSLPHRNFNNQVAIEVDATKSGGPDANAFGVFCRYQDKDNFYRFAISSDGYAMISRTLNGTHTGLSSEKLLPTDAILQGAATNHIRATCMGSTLTLEVNGRQVATATDSSIPGGDVALFANSYSTGGVDILFDDFSASAR